MSTSIDLDRGWRHAFRNGIAPVMNTAELDALYLALLRDSPRLVQGRTVGVLPDGRVSGCAVSYGAAAQGRNVVMTLARFREVIWQAEILIGLGESVWFTNWFDLAPRDEMRRLLLPEVSAELARRGLTGGVEAESPVVVLIADE